MELKHLICNPIISFQLWETGLRIKPTQFFYFLKDNGTKRKEIDFDVFDEILFNDENDDYFAPTADELAIELPDEIKSDKTYHLDIGKDKKKFNCNYTCFYYEEIYTLFDDNIEASTLADLLGLVILELINKKHCQIKGNLLEAK